MAHVFQEIVCSALPTPLLPGFRHASAEELAESRRAWAAFDLSENGFCILHPVGVCLAAFFGGEQEAHAVRHAQVIRIAFRKSGVLLPPVLLSIGRDV